MPNSTYPVFNVLCGRYGLECFQQYKENLHKFFGQIKTIVCHECLILWTLAMPLGKKIKGGFLVPEVSISLPVDLQPNSRPADFTCWHTFNQRVGKGAAACWNCRNMRAAETKHTKRLAFLKIPNLLFHILILAWTFQSLSETHIRLFLLYCLTLEHIMVNFSLRGRVSYLSR